MKRKLISAAVSLFAAAALTTAVYAGQTISLVIDGETVQTDTPPQITAEGRTIVPLRVISETLGADVVWEQEEKKVIAEKDGRILELKIGEKFIYNDGEAMEIDSPAQIINGRTMVPVRVVSESFGCVVDWDGETKTVYISPSYSGGEEDYQPVGERKSLPAYTYKGDKTYMDAICQHLIGIAKQDYDECSVTIPVPLIAEMDSSNPDDIKVWGGFWVLNYDLYDGSDVLQCVSGGSYPGCMHLKKQGDSYSVTKFDVAQDGTGFDSSLRKICGNDEKRYEKIVNNEERREAERKNAVADYVKANKLKITAYQDFGGESVEIGTSSAGTSTSTGGTAASGGMIEDTLPGYFEYSSGAGAWSTNLFLSQDGTFTGFYHDSNMGETGEGYPDGTMYECSFSGYFTNIRKNGNSYTMTLGEVTTEKPAGEEEIYENTKHISTQPYGLETGTEFVLYKPETPLSGLSQDFLSWWPGRFNEDNSQTTLGCYGLLNKATGAGFFGYVYEVEEGSEFTDGMDLG
ncbi:MAG: copper amine oxidase N-terminal domain-containing protein [Firmicutes bacterium]|nr:copper amine oxidase N-terminal domain-containing protein [Bacillota bacterium]